jgi:tRNA A37 threonylcarbamoyladenosine dehydratase
MQERFQERTRLLLGEARLQHLRSRHVCVVGLGGVGSYAAEALARAGVGALTLVDHDQVGDSNLNRQLIALRSTIGRYKVELMAERIQDIDPTIQVHLSAAFLRPDTVGTQIPVQADYVLDCIDSIHCKAALVAACQQRGQPVLSSMGAGGREDPTQIRVGWLAQTQICPLAREMRKRLRRLGASLDYPVVYSLEVPRKGTEHRPLENTETPGRARSVNGTISYLPALFGLTAAGRALQTLSMLPGP